MKLKFGLGQVGQHAPKWLINSASVLTLIIAAKSSLVNGIPALDHEMQVLAKAWVDYILEVLQCVLAIAVIFSGEQKNIEQ